MKSAIPRSLLLQWRLSVAVAFGTLALCAPLAGAAAWRWGAGSAAAMLYLLAELRRHLAANHRSGERTILATLGAGTALTLLRGLLTALLAGFLAVPPPEGWLAWAPGLLYTGVAVADFFDGYLARIHNHVTRLGEALDVRYDALGVLVAIGVLIHLGRLSWPFVSVGLLYYLFHGHMALRAKLDRPLRPLRPNAHRRMYAGFLFGYLAVALYPVFPAGWGLFAGYLFAAPVAAGFALDWLGATGALDLEAPSWRRFERFGSAVLYRKLPLALRLALPAVGGLWLMAGLEPGRGWTSLLAAIDWPAPRLSATLLAIAALAALGMTTAGWLARLAALLLIALACLDVVLRGEAPALSYGLLAGGVGVLLLGVGHGALWGPEDALLMRKAGEARPRRHAGGLPA